MSMHNQILFILAIVFSSAPVVAQDVSVQSELDTSSIMIGQQFRMKVKISQPANRVVIWPNWGDTLVSGIEILEQEKTDTLFSEDKKNVSFTSSYILTSFDSGAYSIPSFPFLVTNGNDTQATFSDPLFIKVNKPEVDTTKDIRDIKGPMDIPFKWKEFLPYVLGVAAAVLVIVLVVLGIVYYVRKRRRAAASIPAPVIPVIPPHVIAEKALLELESKQLWQRGKVKEYYTELTDILRIYIRDVFGIDAPEMVSEEIMKRLRFKTIQGSHTEALRTLFALADMVKFAKAFPGQVENEESMALVRRFITDQIPAADAEKGAEDAD